MSINSRLARLEKTVATYAKHDNWERPYEPDPDKIAETIAILWEHGLIQGAIEALCEEEDAAAPQSPNAEPDRLREATLTLLGLGLIDFSAEWGDAGVAMKQRLQQRGFVREDFLEIDSILPLDDAAALEAANPVCAGEVRIDPALREARENAMLRRLKGTSAAIVLGGSHDLSDTSSS